MGEELRFPRDESENESSDPAVTSAKQALKKGRAAAGRKNRKRCTSCGQLFPPAELEDGLCSECIKDNEKTGEETSLVKVTVYQAQSRQCFNCDCMLFYFLGQGRIQCSRCGAEYTTGGQNHERMEQNIPGEPE